MVISWLQKNKKYVIISGILIAILIIVVVILTKKKGGGGGSRNLKGAYIPNWTVFRAGDGGYPTWNWSAKSMEFNIPDGLDFLCYAFVLFGEDGALNWGLSSTNKPIPALGDPNEDDHFDYVAMETMKIQTIQNRFISVGGYQFSHDVTTTTMWNTVASSSVATTKLANDLVTLCKKYGLNGVDIDWEYPSSSALFTKFISTLQPIISKGGLQLTAAISTNSVQMATSYDFKAIDKYIDWYNLMSYDIGGNFPSPAYKSGGFGANTDFPYIKTGIKYMLDNGVDASKITLGLAAYGRCTRFSEAQIGKDFNPIGKQFTKIDEDKCNSYKDDPKNKASYAGYHHECLVGPYTKSVGYLSYYEIMDLLDLTGIKPLIDQTSSTAYAVLKKSGDNLVAPYLGISFDTPETIKTKIDYVLANKLNGAFVWQVGDDDFRNGFPITQTLINVMNGNAVAAEPSSRIKYTKGICGLKWDETVPWNVDSCNDTYGDKGGTGKFPCFGFPTCDVVLPDTCLVGKSPDISSKSLSMGDFIQAQCGGNVIYRGARYASQFNDAILSPGRLTYCDSTGKKTEFNPSCPSSNPDVGTCISSAMPSTVSKIDLCLNSDISKCSSITC